MSASNIEARQRAARQYADAMIERCAGIVGSDEGLLQFAAGEFVNPREITFVGPIKVKFDCIDTLMTAVTVDIVLRSGTEVTVHLAHYGEDDDTGENVDPTDALLGRLNTDTLNAVVKNYNLLIQRWVEALKNESDTRKREQ